MVESIVVRDGEPLCTEGEEVANNWSVFQMPFSVGYADLRSDDGEELAPERESGYSWNMTKWRDVERVDI